MAYNARGVAYLRQRRVGGALSDFNEAIRLDPKPAKYYANREPSTATRGTMVWPSRISTGALSCPLARATSMRNIGTTFYCMDKKAEAESDFTAARRRTTKRQPALPKSREQ